MANFWDDLNREVNEGVNKASGFARDSVSKVTRPVSDIGGYIGEGIGKLGSAVSPGIDQVGQAGLGLVGGVMGAPGAFIHGVSTAFADQYNELSGLNAQKAANKRAEQNAIKTRRENLAKQMGARQQADSAAISSFRNNRRASGMGGGGIGVDNETGSFIGNSLNTTAGTF